jgi:hypothetical protein
MTSTSKRRSPILATLAAASIAWALVDIASSRAGTPANGFVAFGCNALGGNCTREIPDFASNGFPPYQASIEVPDGVCERVTRVGADVQIEHTWVGDLRVFLTHEASNRTALLLDRPGAQTIGDFGCPGAGVDVRIVDGDMAIRRADDSCAVTIPAIGDTKASALYSRTLTIEADDPPAFGGCDFDRFEGTVVTSGNSTLFADACPPLTVDGIHCDFVGRYNEDCGGEVTVRLTTNSGLATLRILEEAPARFIAVVESPRLANLQLFEEGRRRSRRDQRARDRRQQRPVAALAPVEWARRAGGARSKCTAS